MTGSILIIDDNRDILQALRAVLEDEFSAIHTEVNPNRLQVLLSTAFDVILLDMNFSAGINSGNEGLFWLSKIMEMQPDAFVVLMTAYGNIDLAVESIKRGAKDFILKPWDNEKLIATLRAGLQRKKSKEVAPADHVDFLEGRSPAMTDLQQRIAKIAGTDASVLLLGENGTGKEMIARQLHNQSQRKHRGFFSIDLSAIPVTLFESELFGYKKGAFTDAKTDKAGRIVEANGGTLFLDEIGNLPLTQQSKLLTALQTRECIPLGSNERIPFDIRLISATNAPLQEMMTRGDFRQDLFYRINTIVLEIPPLRDRGSDIVGLANYFLSRYAKRYGKPDIELTSEAVALLQQHHWPGNVRELQHTMEKAVILADRNMITEHDLALSVSSRPKSQRLKTLDEIEKQALIDSLAAHAGNIVHAAKSLGITRQTFYNKMKRYGI